MKPTKTDRIRELLGKGLEAGEIAKRVGTSTQRVCVVRWADTRPGYYAEHMRKKRQRDKEYRERERAYQNYKYRRDADYRKRRVESARRWRARQREEACA